MTSSGFLCTIISSSVCLLGLLSFLPFSKFPQGRPPEGALPLNPFFQIRNCWQQGKGREMKHTMEAASFHLPTKKSVQKDFPKKV